MKTFTKIILAGLIIAVSSASVAKAESFNFKAGAKFITLEEYKALKAGK